MEFHGEQLKSVVRNRLRLYLNTNLNNLRKLSAIDLVEQGYTDAVCVMIKNEPHSLKKMNEGRYRVICLVSIADEIVSRLLNSKQNMAEIEQWADIPSKAGIGMTDVQASLFVRNIAQDAESGDVKAWDFGVREWMMEDEDRVRVALAGQEFGSLYHRCLACRTYSTCRSLFVLSDGTVLEQLTPGIVKSGRYDTASTNSRIRVMVAAHVGVDDCKAMGDDSVEGPSPDKELRYRRLGIEYSASEVPPGYVEFCSHYWELNGCKAIPLNWAKTMFRLLAHAPDLDLLTQFEYEMRHLPELDELLLLLRRIGWDPIKLQQEKFEDGKEEESFDDRSVTQGSEC